MDFTRSWALERHDKAVCEAVIHPFAAVIEAVVKVEKTGDSSHHARHFAEAGCHLLNRDLGLELKDAVMLHLWHGESPVEPIFIFVSRASTQAREKAGSLISQSSDVQGTPGRRPRSIAPKSAVSAAGL